MSSYDVTIVGAGIIGLSCALQLARRSRLSILVLEKGANLGEGSTGASSAVCRCRYSRDEVVTLARDGIHAYRNWQAFTGLASPRAGFHQHGVLWMVGEDRSWAPREVARMHDLGVAARALEDAELTARFPAFSSCIKFPDLLTGEPHDCSGGGLHFLESEGGYMDPVDTMEDLREVCRKLGVEVRMSSRVGRIAIESGKVTGLTLAGGEHISTPLLLNAAGPWCRELYAEAGLQQPWNLVPTRIQVLYLDRPDELPGHIPVSVDMAGGIYFRTQNRGQQLVVGSVLEADEREVIADPEELQREADDDFLQRVLHALHHRFPALPYRGKVRGHCGLYTVNRDDVHPIVGPTAIEGFWVANGFSGHGFKLGPAIGSMVAQAITGEVSEFDTGIPWQFLAIDRDPIAADSKSVLA